MNRDFNKLTSVMVSNNNNDYGKSNYRGIIFLSILSFCLLFFVILSCFYNFLAFINLFAVGMFFYFLIILINCFGIRGYYSFLRKNVMTKPEFISKMSQLFKSNQKLIITANAYNESSSLAIIDGRIHHKGTPSTEEAFSFISHRDISGPFRIPNTSKKLLRLKLNCKITLKNDGTMTNEMKIIELRLLNTLMK